jgi:lipopolysaccharide biosynthesis glycosyltransferase
MGCDEGYRMPLAVMLASVASSLDERYHAVAHVLELGMSDETKSMVERSVPADRMTVRWISVLGDQMAWFQRGLRSYDHFSVASLFRLLLPRLLPPSLDKVIYLDCDMVIRRDLGELWDLDLGNAYLLAVPEQLPAASHVSSPHAIPHFCEIGLEANARYFNAGVMLVNLCKWRAELFTERALSYLKELGHVSRWQDQDALNAVAGGGWAALDPRWNVTLHAYPAIPSSGRNQDLPEGAFIVHFTTGLKPWHPGYALGYGDLFFAHLDETAWANWRPPTAPFSTVVRLKRLLSKAARKRLHSIKCRYSAIAARALRRYEHLKPLEKLDRPAIPKGVSNEIRLFIVLEEWTPVLPFLLSHYLADHVDRVIVALKGGVLTEPEIDLLRAERVHIFATGSAPRHRVLRRMLDRFGCGHWCLLSSGDELLVHPHVERISLKTLCAHLDATGSQALTCNVLDMVASDEANAGAYRVGENPLDRYAHFDPRLRRVETVATDPATGRIFTARLAVGIDDRPIAPTPDFPVRSPFGVYPCRSKVALVKYHRDLGMAADLRAVTGARLSELEGALLNFRQCRLENDRTAARDAEPRMPSASPFPAVEEIDLRTAGPGDRSHLIAFENSRQLIRLGLIRSSAALEERLEPTGPYEDA